MYKKSTAFLQDMQQILYSIRPYLIAYLNDEMLNNYKEEFKQIHGLPPTPDQLNQIFQIKVEKQSCSKEADKIIEALMEKLKRELRMKCALELSLNVAFNIMVITACISYIFLYVGHELISSFNVSVFYDTVFFVDAVVVVFIMLIKTFWDFFIKT